MTSPYLRRVGTARPSHLMFTGGIGGLLELPNFTVLVQGLEEWNYARLGEVDPTVHEPRVLAAVRSRLEAPGVRALRTPPWLEGQGSEPHTLANQVGVPVVPFPSWFRCTFCNLLGSLESGSFGFVNRATGRPFEAEFVHLGCRRRDRFAVPARFLVGCLRGHLDEFPYAWFVHRGGACGSGQGYPALKMEDLGSEAAANVRVRCESCAEVRNLQDAQGRAGEENLPGCRGRHPHLSRFESCDEPSRLLVLGASNQWFAVTVNGLSVPPSQASELEAAVDQLWEPLSRVTSYEVMEFAYAVQYGDALRPWPLAEVWAVVVARRNAQARPAVEVEAEADLLAPEWRLLTSPAPPPSDDFSIRSVVVPESGTGLIAEVRQVERLRLVRALIGFTRFDAPDPDDPGLVAQAPLGRAATPDWVPATEVRGEGLFVRFDLDAVRRWESTVQDGAVAVAHRRAYARFRQNRYSARIPHGADFDWGHGWPGLRYYLVHTLAHAVLRAISLECGYAAASLAERIYARSDDMAGFLIYTAVPDAEGTLGGLASLGETAQFERMLDRALQDAQACSSDPLCAETAPHGDSDACYAAACHVCTFLSETSCERGNRFLDRRLLVDVGPPALAFWTNREANDDR